jgi:hypothetical protein
MVGAMIKRREHWDDDLIRAVIDAGGKPPPPNQLSKDHAYRIIAAVEDWARWEHVPKGTLLQMEQQKAAIQRVRDIICAEVILKDTYQAGRAFAYAQVRAALDGA